VVDLDATEQSSVRVGEHAPVTLPDGRTTPGVISRIGRVATSTSNGGNGPGGSGSGSTSLSATIPVYVTLKHPKAAGSLDQAPVEVQITTATVKHALALPVTALVGRAGGGYAVTTIDAQRRQQPVPVTVGLFDDANGLVQVTGNLAPGQQVLVPATTAT
jgi:hypothetical protein